MATLLLTTASEGSLVMPYAAGDRVIADIGNWLVDEGLRQQPQKLMLPGEVVTFASAPDWTYSVLLNIPVTLDGKQIRIVERLREDRLTALPGPPAGLPP